MKYLIFGTGRNSSRRAGMAGNALQNRCTATVLTRHIKSLASSVVGTNGELAPKWHPIACY
jgi:hypothetical protein